MTKVTTPQLCGRYLKKSICEKYGWDNCNAINSTAEVLKKKPKGDRDKDNLGLSENNDLMEVVEATCRYMLGDKFFQAQHEIKEQDLKKTPFEQFETRVSRIFEEIVDDSAWMVVARTIDPNEPEKVGKNQKLPQMGEPKRKEFKAALATNINQLFDVDPGLKGSDLTIDWSKVTYNNDLVAITTLLIHKILEAQLETRQQPQGVANDETT